MEGMGVVGGWAFRLSDREDACWGMSPARLAELYASCDALLNIVGAIALREDAHLGAPGRVSVETDPVVAGLKVPAGDPRSGEGVGRATRPAPYGECHGARC